MHRSIIVKKYNNSILSRATSVTTFLTLLYSPYVVSLVREHPLYRQNLVGGAMRDRTADLLRAKQALSQLSYSPSA